MSKRYHLCINELARASGRKPEELTEAEIQRAGKAVDKIIKQLNNSSLTDTLETEVMKAVEAEANDVLTETLVAKANAARSIRAEMRIVNKISSPAYKDQPAEGWKAFFGDTLTDVPGAKNGILKHISSLQQSYVGGFAGQLAKKNLLELWSFSVFEKEIFFAKWELGKVVPDLKNFVPEVIEMAKIEKFYDDLGISNYNKAGGWIKNDPTYIYQRGYEPHAIAKAAGRKVALKNPAHFEAWKKDLAELDRKRTMPDVDDDELDQRLLEIYTQLKTGVHASWDSNSVPGLTGFKNIGERRSHKRVLHFLTPEAAYNYTKKYGSGGSLRESFISGLNNIARDTAIMRKASPNAEITIRKAQEKLRQMYIKEGKGEQLQALEKEFKYQMRVSWPYITGSLNVPESNSWAKFFESVRTFNTITQLGKAALAMVNDAAAFGSTRRYYTDRKFSTMVSGVVNGLKAFVGAGEKITPENIQRAGQAGLLVHTFEGNISSMVADTSTSGRLAKITDLFFKLNLQQGIANKSKLQAIVTYQNDLYFQATKTFQELESGYQAALRQFDITPEGWDLIRKSPPNEINNLKFLSPENLRDLELSEFDSLPGVKERIASLKKDVNPDFIREAAREELLDNYMTLYSDIAIQMTSEPTGVEQAMKLHGTVRGTGVGEIVRVTMQYKTFMFSIFRRQWGRELHGYSAARLPIHKAFFQSMKHPDSGALAGMATFFAFGALTGYANLTLGDIMAGRQPRVPHNAEEFFQILGASLLKAGSLGIYGDFLFGELPYGQSFLSSIVGPTAGRVESAKKMFDQALNGDAEAADYLRVAINNTPFMGIFYMTWIMNYLILYRLQEWANPGYLQRMEDRMEKERNQEFLIPPSDIIPYGG